MNIRGFEILTEMRINLPRKSKIFTLKQMHQDNFNSYLDYLYDTATNGASVFVFDYRESINQHPYQEKDVRKYGVQRKEFTTIAQELMHKMASKSVPFEDMILLAHQCYLDTDISYTGKYSKVTNKDVGHVYIDAIDQRLKGHREFHPKFSYACPIIGKIPLRLEEQVSGPMLEIDGSGPMYFPRSLVGKILSSLRNLPFENVNVDFSVYRNGQVFFRDLCTNE